MKKEIGKPKGPLKKSKPKKNQKTPKKKSPKKSKLRAFFKIIIGLGFSLGLLIILALVAYGFSINKEIRAKFEGSRWDIPAQAYARPLEIYAGKALSMDDLLYELNLLGYIEDISLNKSGTYHKTKDTLSLRTREFQFGDGKEPSKQRSIHFSKGEVENISQEQKDEEDFLIRLDPLPIGSFYPGKGEDRTLIKLPEIPKIIPETLITVEDKAFYSHFGINPFAILRATIANIKAGRAVQGGSTITQQLAKNFYLNSERSLTRKIKEAVTAITLEIHYPKEDILEAYLNEVYLAQNGQREIHGIAMASFYYFGRHPKELSIAQTASLIALLKAPSSYNPRRHPERAKKRRNLILGMLAKDGVITEEQAQIEKNTSVKTISISKINNTNTKYPAFMGMVKQQILSDYDKEDLLKDGIKIFTTFNPLTQRNAEDSIQKMMPILDKKARFKKGTLETALVITKIETGEIEAIVGGRNAGLAGFNRALNAKRQIGSLIKPLIYLTALERPDLFTLSTMLDDAKVTVNYPGGTWTPQNYDNREHAKVMLIDALAKSYNLATARLGLKIGLSTIVEKLRTFGYHDTIEPYPSLLLGAVSMSPIQVSQYYLTLANKGFDLPIRTIKSVINQEGLPLKSYDLTLNNVVDINTAFLTHKAMRRVVTHGTARYINSQLKPSLKIAGKTGTTNDYRDSWFAGFSGNYLAVAWVGRDDNKSARLSGTKGALRLWTDTMKRLNLVPYIFPNPLGIEHALVNSRTGMLSSKRCKFATSLPYVAGTSPFQSSLCTRADEIAEKNRRLNQIAEKNRLRNQKPVESFFESLF